MMTNLSDSIIFYSGNNKEGLERYIESTKKDARFVMKFIFFIEITFIAIGLISWTLGCLGFSSNDPMTVEQLGSIALTCLGIYIGGLMVAAILCEGIISECKKQIEKIEYAEQINGKVE